MFKAVRISILLFILFFVAVSTWLTQAAQHGLEQQPVDQDLPDQCRRQRRGRQVYRHAGDPRLPGHRDVYRAGNGALRTRRQPPVRIELGEEVREQPPELPAEPNVLSVMMWSLKMRWWAGSVTDAQDNIEPDVRIFVRYHRPDYAVTLENSVGLQKGMVGIVNGYASRRFRGTNNVIIAHEFLHTLGATDKYSPTDGQPIGPDGLAEPDRKPLYPQRYAEIMGGRIALSPDDSEIPSSLKYAIIGPLTAKEIKLTD